MKRITFALLMVFLTAGVVQVHSEEKDKKIKKVKKQKKKTVAPETAMQKDVKDARCIGTLEKVINELSNTCGIHIKVDWKSLEQTGVTRKTPVYVAQKKATVGRLLSLCLADAAKRNKPLAWSIQDKHVHVKAKGQTTMATVTKTSRPAVKSQPQRRRAGHDVNFDEIPLVDVIDYFRTISGLNFNVNWAGLSQTGIEKTTPVSLKANGLTLAKALNLVLDNINGTRGKLDKIYWIVDKGIVSITTGSILDGKMVARTYDIADLLFVIPNFNSPRIDVTAATGGDAATPLFTGSGEEEVSAEEQKEKTKESIINMIKAMIGEDMWEPTGKGSIIVFKEQLIISQTRLGWKLLGGG